MPCDCSHLVLKSTAKGERRGQSTEQKRLKRGKRKKKNLLSQSARSMTLVCNALAFTLVSGNARAGSVTQIGVISAQRSRASAPSAISGGWGGAVQEAGEEAAAQTQSSDGGPSSGPLISSP